MSNMAGTAARARRLTAVTTPADVLACVLTAVVQLGGSSGIAARHGHPVSVAGYLLLAAGPAALLVRRRFPVGVLWVTVAAAVGYVGIEPDGLRGVRPLSDLG